MKTLGKKKNFLYVTFLGFILVASSALALSKTSYPTQDLFKGLVKEKTFTYIPILSSSSSFPTLSAQAVLAVDINSGVSLYEKNPDTLLLPASTTKIITALVSLDTYPLDSTLKVGRVKIDGQKLGLYTGEEMKVIDLLYALLVYSANDAAEVLASNYPGGREMFLQAMNDKAQELSMTNSKFMNPAGLDGNVTTARDLIRASEVAMKDPNFAKIVSTKETVITDVTGKSVYPITNINELLGKVPGVLGVKTGWTENARENLVTYLDRDDKRIIIAILGSQDRFGETEELIAWIFENYNWEEVKITYSP